MTDTIFISYDRTDASRARQLAERLEHSGFAVWWDRRLLVGERFERSITRALAEARCVVVLWSAASVSSDWVKDEAAEGAARGILVPVLVDEVEIPLGFRQFQTARIIPWDAAAVEPDFSDVITAITQLLAHTKPPAGVPVDTSASHTGDAVVTRQSERAAGASLLHALTTRRALVGACAAIGLVVGLYSVRAVVQRRASTAEAAMASPKPKTNAPAVPLRETPTEAGVGIGPGTFDFRWPGKDCWQVYRGDQRAAGTCGPGKLALQAGRYTVSGDPTAVFAPFEATVNAGATTVVNMGGLLDFKWPGHECWQVHRGDQRAGGACGPGKLALEAGRYTISGDPFAVFVPIETTISTGTTTVVTIGGIFDFKWPGHECWQVHRGDQRVGGICGPAKMALGAGRYTVSGDPIAVFAPFETSISTGATTVVAIGGVFDFRLKGKDCWQVHRGVQRAGGSCGPAKLALDAGRYTVSGDPTPVFAPFSIVVKNGATVVAP